MFLLYPSCSIWLFLVSFCVFSLFLIPFVSPPFFIFQKQGILVVPFGPSYSFWLLIVSFLCRLVLVCVIFFIMFIPHTLICSLFFCIKLCFILVTCSDVPFCSNSFFSPYLFYFLLLLFVFICFNAILVTERARKSRSSICSCYIPNSCEISELYCNMIHKSCCIFSTEVLFLFQTSVKFNLLLTQIRHNYFFSTLYCIILCWRDIEMKPFNTSSVPSKLWSVELNKYDSFIPYNQGVLFRIL